MSLLLITTRQCLFHQVTGCEKERMDETCVPRCERTATIANLRGEASYISKTPGDLCALYHHENFLNTRILTDLPGKFSGLLIDLRDIKTGTKVTVEKPELIRRFQDLLAGDEEAAGKIRKAVQGTTDRQYRKGI